MLLAVAADGVISGEDLEEMLIEVIGRGDGQSAQARAVAGFLVDQPIISPSVLGCENPHEVIGQRLVCEFRESTCAADGGHVITVR
jgi:hypothetical protein